MNPMMMQQGFITPLRVENLDACNWVITEDFVWVGSKGDQFTVKKGEKTDFATVPWWTQSIIPRTGTWTKAAVIHDKMCNLLNEYYRLCKEYDRLIAQGVDPDELIEPIRSKFNSIDTDAIFRKNARDEGTDPIRSELLWFGVRCGALANPARRENWHKTFPRWFADLLVILAILVAIIIGISWAWPW